MNKQAIKQSIYEQTLLMMNNEESAPEFIEAELDNVDDSGSKWFTESEACRMMIKHLKITNSTFTGLAQISALAYMYPGVTLLHLRDDEHREPDFNYLKNYAGYDSSDDEEDEHDDSDSDSENDNLLQLKKGGNNNDEVQNLVDVLSQFSKLETLIFDISCHKPAQLTKALMTSPKMSNLKNLHVLSLLPHVDFSMKRVRQLSRANPRINLTVISPFSKE